IVFVLAQDERRLARRVVQLEPGSDYPAGSIRIEPVVVVEVQLAPGGGVVAGVQLDYPDPAVVGADFLDVLDEGGREVTVDGPDATLAGFAVAPEAAAVHLAGRRRERREVRVAAALPVHVFQRLPFDWRNHRPRPVAQDRVAFVGEYVELAVHAFPPS